MMSTVLAASLNDNFQELETACPEWEKETKAIHPKWLDHHQSGHLTKDPGCPVCMEEARRARSITVERKVTAVQVSCIVI